ncbi:helix-turn-helix domain-containing protein [Candidatus Formimonas warabiya]|uniref:HTH cro/C1-type domain-containing protein n=1 Tax=Formimonas warabiya TaxID=1761012 RepID=A0A3G1KSP2_FORW1|nr:XRE family transcriptional regulator [Candidatus Formimonas warabiya]ATW25447.1 hypothetical protein DCMF_12260 [Candidatus Formimonas warabiya]
MSVGTKLREIRLAKNMSIAEIAEKSQLSQSFISQVERGLNNPSISSLKSICDVLEVPMFQLFIDDENDGMIVRKNSRTKISYPDTNVVYELLSPNLSKSFEVVQINLDQGEESVPRPFGHKGEECVLVLKGKVEAQLGSKNHTLNKGDTIYYDSLLPHTFVNTGKGTAEILVIISPPTL